MESTVKGAMSQAPSPPAELLSAPPKVELREVCQNFARRQSLFAVKKEIRGLQDVMETQRRQTEDLTNWAGESIASEAHGLRRDVETAIMWEREARVAESAEILMVLEALREGLERTNAAVEAMTEPGTLSRIVANAGRACGGFQEERLCALSSRLARLEQGGAPGATEELQKLDAKVEQLSREVRQRQELQSAQLDQLALTQGHLDVTQQVADAGEVSKLSLLLESERQERAAEFHVMKERLLTLEQSLPHGSSSPWELMVRIEALERKLPAPAIGVTELRRHVEASEQLVNLLSIRVEKLVNRINSAEQGAMPSSSRLMAHLSAVQEKMAQIVPRVQTTEDGVRGLSSVLDGLGARVGSLENAAPMDLVMDKARFVLEERRAALSQQKLDESMEAAVVKQHIEAFETVGRINSGCPMAGGPPYGTRDLRHL